MPKKIQITKQLELKNMKILNEQTMLRHQKKYNGKGMKVQRFKKRISKINDKMKVEKRENFSRASNT